MVGHTLPPSWRHARRESWAGLSSLQWYDMTNTTTTKQYSFASCPSFTILVTRTARHLLVRCITPPDQVPAMPDFSGWTARIKAPHLFLLLNYIMVNSMGQHWCQKSAKMLYVQSIFHRRYYRFILLSEVHKQHYFHSSSLIIPSNPL